MSVVPLLQHAATGGAEAAAAVGGLPHGFCYLWNRELIWLHAVSDTLIAAAYITIPFILLTFIRRRRDLPFSWMFVCFAVFIVACGLTHAIEVWSIWRPSWWVLGGVKALTAAASLPTAVLLGRMVPVAVALPSPTQLSAANRALEASNVALAEQVAERERAEGALLEAQGALEERVAERTRDLQEAVAALQTSERDRRVQAERQAALAGLGLRAASGAGLETVFDDAAATVAAVLDAPLVSLAEYRPRDDQLVLRAGSGWAPETIGKLSVSGGSSTPAVYAIRSREAVVVHDYAGETRFQRPAGPGGRQIASTACVVIAGADAPFGVLAAHTFEPHTFSADDVTFLQAAANVVATALQRHQAAVLLDAREAELRQAQKMEAVGRLAGGMAHDFNNLLTIIGGTAALVMRDLPRTGTARTDVETIAAAAERAGTLTRQLLAFSRRQVLQPKVLDLNGVVTGVGSLLRRLIGEDVEVRTALAEDLGLVRADPGQLEQVIMNLAVNARDAMPDGGVLTLETQNVELNDGIERETLALEPGPYVMLAVSDTGMGMDAVTQASMFEPFFTTKEPGKGTGLGLSTVYGIVQQSGGAVYVYSEPGAGTTLKIYLPRLSDTATVPAEPVAAEADAAGESAVILLAEDEPNVRRYTERVLREAGYQVRAAGSGPDAVAVAAGAAGTIDLLLTDMIMPGMSGPELAERLRAERPAMAVLYMSGYTDDTVMRTGVLEEGVTFVQKPFSPASLLRSVAQALGRRAREA